MANADDIVTTVESYVAAFGAERGDWLALFAPDASVEDPVGTEVHHGVEAIGAFWDTSHTMADAIDLVLTGPVRVAGNEAAFPMQVRPVIGGETYVMDVIDTMVFDDDARIVAMRAYWDPATMRPA